ncbi:cystatin-like isoform X2 [Paramormyrops kingsleyae]|uniref:cystatin-like isoform X2 n=1 Tax=Paramormyrops kingsleyae TaxID=1676925 RepID=UPI000CD618A3|nr:cystatin-like isoform X2 [Paramormyrops kingsleyae]
MRHKCGLFRFVLDLTQNLRIQTESTTRRMESDIDFPNTAPLENVSQDDPEVQACLSFALHSFNFFSKELHLYTVTKIHSVKRANIGGGQYHITTEITKSQCKKVLEENKDSCQTQMSPENKVLHCEFVVLSAPWKKQRTLIRSSCTPEANTTYDSQ